MIHSQPLIPSKFGVTTKKSRGHCPCEPWKLTATIHWGAMDTRNLSVWRVAQPRQKTNVCSTKSSVV
jgi:hypothetical protein